MYRSLSLTVLGVSLAFSPVLAAPAKDKPDIDITTRSAAIAVTVDTKLKAYPGLAENLLAEGRRFVARAQAEAGEEYKTNKEWFTDEGRSRRWTYERVYQFRSLVGGRYVSVVRDDGTYTGGAHPNTKIDTILWDRNEKKRISIRPFFTEMADDGPTMTALAKLIRAEVVVAKHERWKDSEPASRTNEPPLSVGGKAEADEQLKTRIELAKMGPVTLAPSTAAGKSSGLTIHYSPYDVDAYAAGPYTMFVPFAAFKQYLSPEGIAIFGGERPKKDAEQG